MASSSSNSGVVRSPAYGLFGGDAGSAPNSNRHARSAHCPACSSRKSDFLTDGGLGNSVYDIPGSAIWGSTGRIPGCPRRRDRYVSNWRDHLADLRGVVACHRWPRHRRHRGLDCRSQAVCGLGAPRTCRHLSSTAGLLRPALPTTSVTLAEGRSGAGVATTSPTACRGTISSWAWVSSRARHAGMRPPSTATNSASVLPTRPGDRRRSASCRSRPSWETAGRRAPALAWRKTSEKEAVGGQPRKATSAASKADGPGIGTTRAPRATAARTTR